MADIKLTLSKDSTLRSPSIEAEKAWLEEVGELWYPLGRYRPKEAHPGSWVYLIRDGHLVARARAESFDPPSLQAKVSYTGSPTNRGSWEVRITRMELARKRLPYRGFQGFRYVSEEERQAFEAAFKESI